MRYLVINLKQYIEPLERREEMLKALKMMTEKAKTKSVEIVIAPQFLECNFYAWHNCNVWTQHVDFNLPGRGTGYVLPETLPINNIKGSIINHSEHRIKVLEIKKTINRLRKIGLKSCICARNSIEVKIFSKFSPDFIAVEPPKLIGGDISVSTAKPSLIKRAVMNAGNSKLLVGAGVKTAEDVKKAIELGAVGVLVASGVAKSNDFHSAINELLDGF